MNNCARIQAKYDQEKVLKMVNQIKLKTQDLNCKYNMDTAVRPQELPTNSKD